jgi:hypothetical protein
MMCDEAVSTRAQTIALNPRRALLGHPVWRWGALGLLFVVTWVASGGQVPLYDGVGFPDEPYRYVLVPVGAKHGPAPKPASASAPARGGRSTAEISVQSAEQGPQVLLQLLPGWVLTPKTAKSAVVTATPLAPDTAPVGGRIDGNVYRLGTMSDVGTASFGPNFGDAFLYLRAASLKPAPPVMEYRTAATSPWVRLHTEKAGTDVFVVAFKGAGDYALVHLRGAKAADGGISQENVLLLFLGGFVVVVVGIAVVSRRPWRPDPTDHSVGS